MQDDALCDLRRELCESLSSKVARALVWPSSPGNVELRAAVAGTLALPLEHSPLQEYTPWLTQLCEDLDWLIELTLHDRASPYRDCMAYGRTKLYEWREEHTLGRLLQPDDSFAAVSF